MSIRTIFKCDRCETEFETEGLEPPQQRWCVGIVCFRRFNAAMNPVVSANWCRKCADDAGLLSRVDRQKQEEEAAKKEGRPVPTISDRIEDLLRELIADEAENLL